MGSPELVTALAIAGDLTFDPTRDTLINELGEEVKLDPPVGDDLPKNGFAVEDLGYQEAIANGSGIEVVVNPGSERLALLSPFEPWDGENITGMKLLIKAKGKCTTDHISMAGPWLRFRGHLDNISNNMLTGAVNYYTDKTNIVKNQLTGENDTVPDVQRAYKAAGVSTIVVGDENYGEGLYRDNTQDLGLLKVHLTMGANFGDVNNDGYDDLYLGTGYPAIDSLVPNAFYFNKEGLSFIDKTHIYGLGHIQKGHGVAFADYDLDGDLDIFEQMGGFYLSDGFTNILYQNSNNTNNWIGIKLIGSKSGKIALGAKLNLVCDNKNYNSIVEPGGSFGSSSLIKVMGIQDCKNIDKLYITWPRDQSIQEINKIAVNQYILIKESELGYKKINFKVGNKIE